jgi:8-amino-7-oxononanoate synthase
VLTLTLSKSLGAQGGAVLAHSAVREQLVNTARSFIYDTGLAPAAAGAALAALQVLGDEPERAKQVRANAAVLADAIGVEPPAGAVLSRPMPGPDEALAAVAQAASPGAADRLLPPPVDARRDQPHPPHRPCRSRRSAPRHHRVARDHRWLSR